MKRQIIKIDEELCNGCGECVPECHEGAIQIIEGKARLISDLFCDGLGACIGHCPVDAITIEEREAEPYDEIKVMESLTNSPPAVLEAHLKHLIDHNEIALFDKAVDYMKIRGIANPILKPSLDSASSCAGGGCPGSKEMTLAAAKSTQEIPDYYQPVSELRQWPVHLHLVRPEAQFFKDKELVIMSVCGPIANAAIHQNYLKNRAVVVACPKLDYTQPYIDKLSEIFQYSGTKKVKVVIMEVPCCKGLSKFAAEAGRKSGRNNIIIEEDTLSINGDLKGQVIIFKN